MSKELRAFRKICRCLSSSYEFTDEYEKNKKLIETALKEKEEQDEILDILKTASKEHDVFYITTYSDYPYAIEDGSDGYRCMELNEEKYNLLKQWLEK